jgi:hypothetical protein
VSKSKNDSFSSKNIKDAKAMTDVDGFESGNTKVVEEFDLNVKSDNLRRKRNDIDRDAHGRYRRYVLESGKYIIPGLEPDYFQPSNGISIRNLIRRRNRADRLQKLARTSKQEGNIPTLLYDPHHRVSFEDVNEGFPMISSDEYDVNPFPAGTIYIRQSGESPDERNRDYDYIDKDENMYGEDENVLYEPEYFHGPAEYFEIFQKSGAAADGKFVGYGGELSEAESIVLIKSSEQEEEHSGDDEDDDKVIQEQGPTEEEDRKTKAATDSMLQKYFTETYKQDFSDEEEDFETVRRVREKHKTDLKKEISNRRKAEEREREYSDEVISEMADHINKNPDSSIHTVKRKKAAINDHSSQDNDYDDDSFVSAEEVKITRSSRKVKETVTEDHDKNIPSNAKEYYKEGSHIFRTRRQGKGNSKNNQSSEEDDQDSYDKSSNHESSSASQGTARQSKGRARKMRHRVIYGNSDEDDSSSDTRSNHSKQTSKSSITQKPSHRRAKNSNEHDESESEPSKQSKHYNVKSRPHKTDDSHKQIDSSSNSKEDTEEKVIKTYSKRRKYEKAPYHSQPNINNNRDYKVDESAATVKGQKFTESINPSYRNKSSKREPSNTYRTTGQRETQNNVLFEEQSGEESRKYMKHSSRTEVTSNESEETSGIDEEKEEATEMKIKANKSRQRNQITMRPPTGNRKPRYRARRDVTPQLPLLVTSVENGQKGTEVQNKDIESEELSDHTNAKLQIKPRDVKENKQLEAAYQNVPTARIINSNGALQWDNRINSSEDNNKQMREDDSTENYISLKEHEEGSDNEYKKTSGDEHEKYKKLTAEINKDPQCKMSGTSLDEDNYEESKGPGTNSKILSDGSLQYMGPEQLQNDANIKQEIGTSLMYKSSNDITINGIMKVHAAQHQDEDGLKVANSVQEGKWRDTEETAVDTSLGETMLPATSVTVLMDTSTESVCDRAQQTSMGSSEEVTADADGVKKFHKTQDDALNMKLYQEPKTGVIRLRKAIATHMNPQNGPAKVGTGGNDYTEHLMSMKEKFNKNIKNTIVTDEEMEKTREWNVDIPVKTAEVQQEEGNLSKAEHRSALMPHNMVPSFTAGKSNEEMTVSVPGGNRLKWIQNQEINQKEDTWLHSSEGREPEKESLREEVQHGKEREAWSHEETKQRNEIANVKIPLEAAKQGPVKSKTSSEEDEQKVHTDVVEKLSGDTVSVQSLANDVASKQTPSLNSKANSDSNDATSTESSGSQVQIVIKKLPVIDDIKGNIHSIIDRTGTNVPKSSYALKQNLKNVHNKVTKADDKIFKITDNIRDSRSAHQSSGDGDPDNNGLAQIANLVPKQFKAKNGEPKQHHKLGAEEVLENIPNFMDGNFAVSSNEKETDGTNGKLENFEKNYIADDEDVSAALVRNAKHIGHLKPILHRREHSHHLLDNTKDHTRLQASTLAKTEHIKAELEKKRLERLHVLKAQRIKLKEDLLKIRAMAAEGKLKLPHHIVRRDTTQDENIESLISNSVLDDASDSMRLQLNTFTKTEKIKAELEKKRTERLHALAAQRAKLKEDLLKIKAVATEGKLKLPHHIRRRDTTHDEYVESLMSNTETKDFYPLISIQNEDRKGYSNRDNPSVESQNVTETDSDLSSHKGESNDKHFPQDTHSWLEQIILPVSMVADQRDVQVPAFDGQQVYKPPHYSESDILPRNYVSGSEFVRVPKYKGKTLVEESKIFNSGTTPFFTLYDRGSRQMYAESLFQEGHGKERNPDKENISEETILDSGPDQRDAEDESSEGHYIEIKQLSLPFLISRPVLENNPMMAKFKNMPISENDIRFFLDSEIDEVDDDGRDLARKQKYVSPTLQVAGGDYAYSIMSPRVKDDASLNEMWDEQNAKNTQASLMPVTEETDPNEQIFLQVDHLPEELNKRGAGWDRRQGSGKKMDESKYEDKKSGRKYIKSFNKIIRIYQPLHDELDEVNPSTLRILKRIKNVEKRSALSKSNMLDETHAHSTILQSLTHDLDRNSELIPGSGNSHTVPIRSKRALAYQFKNKFNDDLLKPTIMTNKDNPKIKDDINGKYWLQNLFSDILLSLETKQQSGEPSSNMYVNVMMPENNAVSFSNVTSENNILPDMEKFEYNSDSMPTNSLNVTDIKLITDYESKDLKPVSHENREASQTSLESLGNYLNDIINVQANDDTESNKIEDALSETSDVNLQTNEINRRFRTSDSFVKSKHENNIKSAESEGNAIATKRIPYELSKNVLNSNYEPSYIKIRKYLYPLKYKHLAASSEEFPSIEYLSHVNKLGNRSSPSNETSDASKEIFSVTLEEFPNINSKSEDISETTPSNDTTVTAEEIPKTATEIKDISKVPMSNNIMTNTDTEYVIEQNVKKWNKESSLIPQTYPQDELNYPFRSMKNGAALEQEAVDSATVTNTEENAGYSVIIDQNTEHVETPNGQNKNGNNREEKKPISTSGHIHKFIKNIAGRVVRFLHKLSPWNYFSY